MNLSLEFSPLKTPRVPIYVMKWRRYLEFAIESILFVCMLVSVLTTIGILIVLGGESISFFLEVSLVDFLTDTQWTPLFAEQHFGILPLLQGTLLVAFISMAVALPFGLLAAIYLAEFASKPAKKWLKPTLELLAGIPTVVYGYFAFAFVTPALQQVIPNLAGFNALAPGLVMGIMMMPLICSLSEDALSSVPQILREAAFGLGARRVVVILKVILPSALSGISTAVALAFGRAVGETMIVTIAAGQRPTLTFDPRVPIETMTAFIMQISMGDAPEGTLEYKAIFVVGASLFMLTLATHSLGMRFSRRFHRGVV